VSRQVKSEIARDEDVVGRVRRRRCHAVPSSHGPHALLPSARVRRTVTPECYDRVFTIAMDR
jgi:hypothetical protein